jgi:hypothetical protein
MAEDRIEIQNINTPGRTERVNRAKYEAVRDALLQVLPSEQPGMTPGDAKTAILHLLPDSLFPEGKTVGWWLKAVQLDLEAKGVVQREPKPPVRLFRSAT